MKAFVRFNIKVLNGSISQDSGIQTKDSGTGDANLKLVALEFLTENTVGFSLDVNDVIVYGGALVKNGPCIGYCYLYVSTVTGRRYVLGVTSFHAVRSGNDVYVRFSFPNQNFRSSYFIENGA